jgi:4-amino-4-deoxy-L-arabinose transferase-like glycosyltransferase
MGPGSFYWLAAFLRVFGVTFMASRICRFISSLGTALLIYLLSRRLSSGMPWRL